MIKLKRNRNWSAYILCNRSKFGKLDDFKKSGLSGEQQQQSHYLGAGGVKTWRYVKEKLKKNLHLVTANCILGLRANLINRILTQLQLSIWGYLTINRNEMSFSIKVQRNSFLVLLLLFSHSLVSEYLRLHRLQYTRLLCPSPSPRVCSN